MIPKYCADAEEMRPARPAATNVAFMLKCCDRVVEIYYVR